MSDFFLNTICTIIGAAVGYYFATKITKKNIFNNAAIEFRNEFTDFIQQLKVKVSETDISSNADCNWVKTTLDKIATNHHRACIRFEPFVDKSIRHNFIAAYEHYLYPNKHDEALSDPRADYWTNSKPLRELRVRKIICGRLGRVLKFTEI
jgi:uncharacterized protein YneF (UPF0154 family)